jgi:hypothetical protein
MIPLPISLPDPSLECFATIEETIPAALQAAVDIGVAFEAGGAIYQHGTLVCFTKPVTQHLPDAIDYRVGLVSGDHVLALFHTHPGASETEREFSYQDKTLARKLHLPMYVRVVHANLTIHFQP